MAFHFNWSPLIADTDRVRHMLTSSLNRSPKPPIIVDDIIVNELNLGQTPPSLEILEIGDLAEDRFRGIFKVKYEGDAYLQLRTKVQANPLNTFLSSKSGFASPDPLAAGSGLTIPLQITLSEIRLSGFVILVFNKQKGITLVFRNDPIESLKVSSTFDSIPFVRNYLQKTIEEQLRVLFVEDLPAIIHRLSLRVFNSEDEKSDKPADEAEGEATEATGPPTSSTEQDTAEGNVPLFGLSAFEGIGDNHAPFSQNNLLRLAALTESQRTLSLFTPSIRDTVFRAWASAHERDERQGGSETPTHRPTSLSRIQLSHGGGSSVTSQASDVASQTTRPSLSHQSSVSTTYSLASGRSRTHGARKKKHRVVNLRRNQDGAADGASDIASVSSEYTESASRSGSISASGSTGPTSPLATNSHAPSVHAHSAKSSSYREGEVQTPSTSPKKKVEFQQRRSDDAPVVPLSTEIADFSHDTLRPRHLTPRPGPATPGAEDGEPTPRASMYLPPQDDQGSAGSHQQRRSERRSLPRMQTFPDRSSIDEQHQHQPRASLTRNASDLSISDLAPAFNNNNNSGGSRGSILEQAWMMKMATDLAKRVAEENERESRRGSQAVEGDAASTYTS